MFHSRTGQFSALIIPLALLAHPMSSHATEEAIPGVTAQTVEPVTVAAPQTQLSPEVSLDLMRNEVRTKMKESGAWVKEKKSQIGEITVLDDLERATDRLQDSVTPMGRELKSALKKNIPGASLVQRGDRTVTVYGLILMMALAFVVLMMSLASPESRLGGRH